MWWILNMFGIIQQLKRSEKKLMKGEKFIQLKQVIEYMMKMELSMMKKLVKNIMGGVVNMMKSYV